jgi:heme/copper-type cytochrome/quinol oxidase subunit 2
VVEVKSKDDFDAWIKGQQALNAAAAAAAAAAAEPASAPAAAPAKAS